MNELERKYNLYNRLNIIDDIELLEEEINIDNHLYEIYQEMIDKILEYYKIEFYYIQKNYDRIDIIDELDYIVYDAEKYMSYESIFDVYRDKNLLDKILIKILMKNEVIDNLSKI